MKKLKKITKSKFNIDEVNTMINCVIIACYRSFPISISEEEYFNKVKEILPSVFKQIKK